MFCNIVNHSAKNIEEDSPKVSIWLIPINYNNCFQPKSKNSLSEMAQISDNKIIEYRWNSENNFSDQLYDTRRCIAK